MPKFKVGDQVQSPTNMWGDGSDGKPISITVIDINSISAYPYYIVDIWYLHKRYPRHTCSVSNFEKHFELVEPKTWSITRKRLKSLGIELRPYNGQV